MAGSNLQLRVWRNGHQEVISGVDLVSVECADGSAIAVAGAAPGPSLIVSSVDCPDEFERAIRALGLDAQPAKLHTIDTSH